MGLSVLTRFKKMLFCKKSHSKAKQACFLLVFSRKTFLEVVQNEALYLARVPDKA
ncbi:hypothetical protein M23134_04435 [Microscilla marina ATCC 23134]|uniref:Uncharacterized protein n=1 Tax=Microscilla marina ATCC 23134 TaxID=313606 RepID=A1ZM56_MICM2|nr:hypothetical protein M23134_04435 [Microscilla marina ATCC 23134]